VTAIVLTRRDPEKNVARFYRLDVQPDLFGGWSLGREWDRIGQAGQVRRDPYPTAGAAQLAQASMVREKAGRGYLLANPSGSSSSRHTVDHS